MHHKECTPGYDRAGCTPIFIAALFTNFGSSPVLSQLMNGFRKCGVYTQWSFIQP
jgi:hypothetical protein